MEDQTRADISAFESLQADAHRSMPLSQNAVFNDRARLDRIRELYGKLEGDLKNAVLRQELNDLMNQEEQFWTQLQNEPEKVTEELRRECDEFVELLYQMNPEVVDGRPPEDVGRKTAYEAIFLPHPGFGMPRKRPDNE